MYCDDESSTWKTIHTVNMYTARVEACMLLSHLPAFAIDLAHAKTASFAKPPKIRGSRH